MEYALDARVDDKLSRFSTPYKQLVHYLAQNFTDEQCAQRMKTDVAHICKAVEVSADTLGVPTGSYVYRRSELQFIGKKFFGLISPTKDSLQPDVSALHFPPLEELAKRIQSLPLIEQQRLRVVVEVEDGDFELAAKTLAKEPNTVKMYLPIIAKKLGFATSASATYGKKRREYIKQALELMEK